MKISLNIRDSDLVSFSKEIRQKIEDAKPAVQAAMALEFQEIVLSNFGASGQYRPWSGWPPLSPAYARKVGRDFATLEVSGKLKNSIFVSADKAPDCMVVEADDARVPYSTVHQYGGGNNIPRREYFPVFDDGAMFYPEINDRVQAAAEAKLMEILS